MNSLLAWAVRRRSGLILETIIVPAAYALLMLFVLATAGGDRGITAGRMLAAAFLVWLLVSVSGAVKWWDVWVKPAPKLGADWEPVSPQEWVREGVILHVLAIAAIAAVHMVYEQFVTPDRDGPGYSAGEGWLGFVLVCVCLYVPGTVRMQSGEPITTGAGEEEAEEEADESEGVVATLRRVLAEDFLPPGRAGTANTKPPEAIPVRGDAASNPAPLAKLVDDGIERTGLPQALPVEQPKRPEP